MRTAIVSLEPRWLDRTTLARRLGVDEHLVDVWVERGILASPSPLGGDPRWKLEKVESAYDGVVYFVQCANFIKIGYSRNFANRLATMRPSVPFELVVLHTARGTEPLEAYLHQKFAHLRERGEWFRAEPELLDYVAHLKRGGNVS